MKRTHILLILFLSIGLLEIISIIQEWEGVQLIAKPLLMPLLIMYHLERTTTKSRILIGALLFCWIGDVLLMFQQKDELFFLAGLGAFLLGHMLYIATYRQFQNKSIGKELIGPQKIRFSLPILLTGMGLITVIYPGLGSLAIPVIIYAVVIMIMVLTALYRFGKTNAESFWLIFVGALLFMGSDSIIAINKFYVAFSFSGLAIMSTYLAGQFMIVEGIARHK